MPEPVALSADDLLEDILSRVDLMAGERRERVATLTERRADLIAACRGLEGGIVDLDGAGSPVGLRAVAVDGGHVADVDRGESFSVSVAFALHDDGGQRSTACMAALPHTVQLNEVSVGLMFMQEVMLAVAAAEDDLDRVVLIDGSRVSTLIALNAFYMALARYRPGTLADWRADPEGDPGRVLLRFESENWLQRYLLLPNLVGNTKLVTSRRLVQVLRRSFGTEDGFRRTLRDLDDKTVANVVLAPASDGFHGQAMGPVELRAPCTPFHVMPDEDGDGDGYPRAHEVEQALDALSTGGGGTGFLALYVNPTRVHGAFSVEVNRFFQDGTVADAVGVGRGPPGWRRTIQGLGAYFGAETGSVDIQEPYLTHVADTLCKRTVTSAKRAYLHVAKADAPAGLAWSLSRPHRTSR